ncbi:MAG: hypothetical protein WBK08_18770 [Nitrospira sp.]
MKQPTDRPTHDTPATMGGACSPAHAKQTAFPVRPGGAMPPVEGCAKQDYAVLIVISMGVDNQTAVAQGRLARRLQ